MKDLGAIVLTTHVLMRGIEKNFDRKQVIHIHYRNMYIYNICTYRYIQYLRLIRQAGNPPFIER